MYRSLTNTTAGQAAAAPAARVLLQVQQCHTPTYVACHLLLLAQNSAMSPALLLMWLRQFALLLLSLPITKANSWH
jgi:hypothetical protein